MSQALAFQSSSKLPRALVHGLRRYGVNRTRFILTVDISSQSMSLFEKERTDGLRFCSNDYRFVRRYRVSTSAFGIGQVMNSNQTPLGLHRVAEKIGGGHPIGTVFRSRKAVGLTWQGQPDASIVHRILWLEGLEPGFNRDGNVDTYERYIYVHGFSDETTLGRPQSHGCIHLAAKDLMPLFDRIPTGTLVWIAER